MIAPAAQPVAVEHAVDEPRHVDETLASRGPGLDVRGVELVYPGRRSGAADGGGTVALNGIDLEVPAGQFVSLVGASGCGKTSLLNLAAGLVRPTRGQVLLQGEPPRVGRPEVGYMLARDSLLPWRTTVRNVELGLEPRSVPRQQRRERATELLKLVGLAGFEDAFPRQLSQGMRQRAALARTLAPSPTILLMDEPFAALDARTKLHVQAEFLRIWEGTDAASRPTVLFVTHDLQEALLLSDRVVVMLPRPGRIASDRLSTIARPRAEHLGHLLFSDGFRELHEELFNLLEGDVAAGQEALR